MLARQLEHSGRVLARTGAGRPTRACPAGVPRWYRSAALELLGELDACVEYRLHRPLCGRSVRRHHADLPRILELVDDHEVRSDLAVAYNEMVDAVDGERLRGCRHPG